MNISNVISPSILQTAYFETASAQPVADLFTPTTFTSIATTSSASIVDISSLGNLLSVVSTIGDGLLQGAATSPSGLATVVSATQLFVDAFNNFLQSGLDNLQNPSGGSLGSQFVQELNAQTTTAGNGESLIASLASVGINFQSPSILNSNGQLAIDIKTLQTAFNADPVGTSSQLAQTFKSVGQLAAEFTGQVVQLESLSQISNAQSALAAPTVNGIPVTAATTTTTTTATSALLTATTIPPLPANVPVDATGLLSATVQPTVTGLPATATQATTTAPLVTAAATPVTTSQFIANTTGLPTVSAQATAAGQLINTLQSVATVSPATITQPTAATLSVAATAPAATPVTTATLTAIVPLAAADQLATTVQPAVTGLAATAAQTGVTAPIANATSLNSARLLTTTTEPLTTVTQPTVSTPLAASITTVATTLPTEAQLPITAAQSTAATPFPATVTALPASATTAIAPATTRSNFVNALIVATDPATAAAIAAYHLVDGIFDTGKGIIQGLSPAAFGYSEILPIAKIRPVQLDIYA